MKKALTIAGSDCSGGAGIQADLKTMTAHRIYGMSVVTALTAQNTTGVFGVLETSPEFVAQQMDAVFTDIFPDAVKIGMVSNSEIISVIAERLRFYNAKNIVVDPVMVSTSGSRLMADDAISTLKTELLTLADVITPNIPEAECLCGFPIRDARDMERAAREIGKMTRSVLIKGGHMEGNADDLLFHEGRMHWFPGHKIENPNTHGTGCTLSSAIACRLAEGMDLASSIECAKAYVTGALASGLDLGQGSGPLDHSFDIS
jgi:hydroxymethylpyrimidine/phosphomethylpyrimidine kinase